jgi:hypothetical protein
MRYVVYTVTPCNLVGGRNPEDRSINPHTLSEAWMYRGFPPCLPDKQRPDIVITAIVCYGPVTDC